MKKLVNAIVIIAIVIGLGYATYKMFIEEKKHEETEVIKADPKTKTKTQAESDDKGKDTALPVRAIQIKRGDLPLRLSISATADVWEKSTVRAEVGGTVETIYITVGSNVKKDQTMIKLDDVERKLDVEYRKSERLRTYSQYLTKEDVGFMGNTKLTPEQKQELVDLKQKYLQSVKEFEAGKISEKDFAVITDNYQKALIFSGDLRDDIRKAQEGLSAANTQLQLSELNLKRTSILSPFPGTISDLKVSKGEKVNAGQELLKIVNLQSLYLKGYALEAELANLKVGTNVRVKFDAYPDQHYYGTIQSISPEIDLTRKTVCVYIKIDNRSNLFMPGMHAEIDVEYKIFKDVIKVPRNAVVYRQERYLVFVVRDIEGSTGTAYWEYVTIGNQNDEEYEILSGVQEGDLVLIEGNQTLAHQSRVKIVQ